MIFQQTGGAGPQFVRHTGRVAPYMERNVNTDVIAPSNPNDLPGLTAGERFFEGIRYFEDGTENPDFVLNREIYRNASFMIVGENFGTGSSRGSAVSRPMAFGLRAVIGTTFGPYFLQNCSLLGFLAVSLDEEVVARLADWTVSNPGVEISIDLPRQVIEVPGMQTISFTIDPRTKNKLLTGLEDFEEMLQHSEAARAFRDRDRNDRAWAYPSAAASDNSP